MAKVAASHSPSPVSPFKDELLSYIKLGFFEKSGGFPVVLKLAQVSFMSQK